jgi:hypothetical protein
MLALAMEFTRITPPIRSRLPEAHRGHAPRLGGARPDDLEWFAVTGVGLAPPERFRVPQSRTVCPIRHADTTPWS